MTAVGGMGGGVITIRRLGVDDHSSVRYLHVKAMQAQSADALSQAEIEAFESFVRSPAYSDALMAEDVYGAFASGQLIGTASWHVNGDDGRTARISSVFVHPAFCRLGIGRRLLSEVEARARQSGFAQFGISATINAVPFFEKLGYREASRGVKVLGAGCALPVAFLRKAVNRLSPVSAPAA